tara:strand:- start:303 stop:569 length:267 start_codon:yes stop_codon:yes gene_type:complete
MIDWIKPSGLAIKTNEDKATVAHCEGMGWKRAKPASKEFNHQDLTVERINGMSVKEMSRLNKQLNLGVATMNLDDMRVAMINALFEPE